MNVRVHFFAWKSGPSSPNIEQCQFSRVLAILVKKKTKIEFTFSDTRQITVLIFFAILIFTDISIKIHRMHQAGLDQIWILSDL